MPPVEVRVLVTKERFPRRFKQCEQLTLVLLVLRIIRRVPRNQVIPETPKWTRLTFRIISNRDTAELFEGIDDDDTVVTGEKIQHVRQVPAITDISGITERLNRRSIEFSCAEPQLDRRDGIEGVRRTLRLGIGCRRVTEPLSRGGWFAVIDGDGRGR
ncbi:hypothetical protein [uncultured Ilumatobacter sp.]|uniref:hypothetical protein n=1 Tax=uncultured Ilumatobacter sp. TaxID=879968 RepID=UPI00374FC2C7